MADIAIDVSKPLKQPTGLYKLFTIELWERFGFYSVQALLVLFLTKAWHRPDAQAYDLFSAFSALIYATPVIGGFIADRLIGYRRSVLLGAILFSIGYFLLAVENRTIFYIGLAFLICGNGFFKGCVSSLLGTLYGDEKDPRRDSGFTIFYMGINLGAFFGPLISTWAATKYGWGYGFALPGFGMIIAFLLGYQGFKKFDHYGEPPNLKKLTEPYFLNLSRQAWMIIFLLLIVVPAFAILILHPKLVSAAFIIFAILAACFVFGFAFQYDKQQRNKMFLLVALMIFSIFFWALYLQMFSSLTLFIERLLNRKIMGHVIPASVYISVNAFYIIVFSPILAAIWIKLRHSRYNPSLPTKFALGLLFLGLAFLILCAGIYFSDTQGFVAQTWLLVSYLSLTIGELCLSPIGLSMITALAPANLTGMMMGVWFLMVSIGYAVGDYIANLTSIPTTMTDLHAISHVYSHIYLQLGLLAVIISAVLFVLVPRLKRLVAA